MQLRPYQINAVDDIRQAFKDAFKAVMLVLCTGAGKTVIFSYISKNASEKNKTVWILVHRVELLRQTSAALTRFGVKHGLVNPQFSPDPFQKVQVASVQTMIKRMDKFPKPDMIVIDECHHSISKTYRTIIDANPQAIILGVTATPCRSDGTGLDHIFDKIIVGPQISELIDLGYLVKPKVYAPAQKIDFSAVNIVRGDYDAKQVTELLDKPSITGDAVEHYIRYASGRPAVAFCTSIAHAEHVAEAFRNRGYRFYSVDGTMDDETRKRLLDGLGDGSIDGICSCDLISEGTDIPAIGCAILLRPTQSLSLYIQQIGRALRTQDGKTNAIILDHVGNVIVHGFPTIDREWSLEGSKRTKKSMSEANIRVFQCTECFAVHEPAPECPECGFVYPVLENSRTPEQIDGELKELDEAMVKKQKSTEVAKARTFEDLLEIEKERGYKRGWARNMIRFRNTTEFNRLMSDADNFIRVENYSKARERFDKALEMNIDNSRVNESIQMLEMLIQEKFQEII
jgi:superfamily II DNA or RNA helicase